MIILLHSSKTMRTVKPEYPLQQPALIAKAEELATYIKGLPEQTLQKVMSISPALAAKTKLVYTAWSSSDASASAAMDSFVGDIYSGLRAAELSSADREYAQQHLRILSGLYGILKPLDGICAYRLELAYKFPDEPYKNLYTFWGDSIAKQIPKEAPVLNLAANEYSKTVLPFIEESRVITPRFLTIDPKTKVPKFIVVHAKIARGAFARWVIQNRIEDTAKLCDFSDIGYVFSSRLSTLHEPVFVCQEFGGKGLSMRLS